MKSCHRTYLPTILYTILLLSISHSPAPAQTDEAKGDFLYYLSSFQGDVSFGWARITVDRGKNEIYVIGREDISIFNERGMEVYRFGRQEVPGNAYDVAVKEDGTILFLTYKRDEYSIVSCNFRGVPVTEIAVTGLPESFSEFRPDRIVYREKQLYLADSRAMMIAVTDADGRYVQGYDVLTLFGLDEKERSNKIFTGFSVDGEGNMLFTVSVMFKAFRLSPEGEIASFGKAGSIAGRFGVVAGIASDNRGNILIVDTLRCVVMVFSGEDFSFVTEFGYRGLAPGKLIAPKEVAVDGKGRIYVTQARRLSISVFRIDRGTPEQNNEILPGQKGEVPRKSGDDSSFGEITEESIEIPENTSSD
jgi:hypothetical protein